MIRHIVLWELSADDPSQRERDAAGVRERLEALAGVVPGLASISVRTDVGSTEGNWDVTLVSEHDDEAALAAYQAHPAHVQAAAFIRTVVAGRACVDYEL